MKERLELPSGAFRASQFNPDRHIVAKNALEQLRPWLKSIPRDGLFSEAGEFRGLSKSRYFNLPDFYPFKDGVAIVWNTRAFLEDRAHRLIILDDGGINYHRESFDVDFQKIRSPSVDLVGLERVTNEIEAVNGMTYAADLICMLKGGGGGF
jgi:hypothetical protein